MTGLDFLFNALAFVALFYYVFLRLYKIKYDFTEGTGEWTYYIPTAIAAIFVITYGAAYTLPPLIASGCIEFLLSFGMLFYFTFGDKCGCRKTFDTV